MKLLVVGCGSIGRRHALNAAKLARVGVYDVSTESARRCGEACDGKVFDDLEAALSWQADGVIVATPHNSHLDVARSALAKGSNVIVEKPISDTLSGVENLIEQAQDAGLGLFVACNMRFHPAVEALRANLTNIGKPLFARAHYGNYLPSMRPGADYRELYCASQAMGGGVVRDAVHEIDYLVEFFGPVTSVVAAADRLSDLEIDVEDYAQISLKHKTGVRSEIHLDYLQQRKQRGCEIVGTDGTLVWYSDGKTPEACEVKLFRSGEETWETLLADGDLDGGEAYMTLLRQFVAAIEGKTVPLAAGRDGAHVLTVALAALDSAKHGRATDIR